MNGLVGYEMGKNLGNQLVPTSRSRRNQINYPETRIREMPTFNEKELLKGWFLCMAIVFALVQLKNLGIIN